MDTENNKDAAEALSCEGWLALITPDLEIYNAVRLAKKCFSAGNKNGGRAFLRADADKIRMHSEKLYALLG